MRRWLWILWAISSGCGSPDGVGSEAGTDGTGMGTASMSATAGDSRADSGADSGAGSADTSGQNTPTGGSTGDDGGPVETDFCEFSPPGPMPVVALPEVARGSTYELVPEDWGVATDGTNAADTTEGLQAAIDFAQAQGSTRFVVPPGDYLVGREGNDIYWAGIELPSDMVFEMQDGAVLTMETNDRWNYCIIAVGGAHDVVIRGGEIVGDRSSHIYEGGGAHDEGHAVCIEGNSERVLVEDTVLRDVTGDGVLIVGSGDAGNSCFDITIRNNEIHDNRRQGVSIVGGVRVAIEDNEIHHINGTSPQFGVDVESLDFLSADILIRNNHFHANAGGDLVNTDGTNLWFVDNVCDQTGLSRSQTDGPIVHWGDSDNVVRRNTITVTVGSSNGRWGIIGYSGDDPDRPGRGTRNGNTQPNYFEDNVFIDAGLHLARTELFVVRGNEFTNGGILGSRIDCLRLEANDVNGKISEPYKFREVAGEDTWDNRRDGSVIRFLMGDDAPYTNSPPHLW
ncbi:MAG: right-handed parallel beta-helix repeat-containing protein [Nannocystaceae bacterium]|nr:right-handed parallel beta-helix repeat-containing protein [Nannocystaceae bacterium]